jgi:hypothetical protein
MQHSEATIDRGRVALGALAAARNRVPQRQLAVRQREERV